MFLKQSSDLPYVFISQGFCHQVYLQNVGLGLCERGTYRCSDLAPEVVEFAVLFNCISILLFVGGDLHYHLSQHGVFSEKEMRFYATEIILGLEHMHNRFVVYRDLKVMVTTRTAFTRALLDSSR